MRIAVHLGTSEQAEALFVLALAGQEEGARNEERLWAMHKLLQAVLTKQELVGREAANEVERRRTEASQLVEAGSIRNRIATAPRAYVLRHSSVELARHAALCEPTPRRSEVRVSVELENDGARVELTAHDRVGLLARATGVLLDAGCSVNVATAATWPDETALASYHIHVPVLPVADDLRVRLEHLLDEPLIAAPVPDIELDFDDEGSPWHTRCTATGPDRPGLLHSLTSAFAAAGVSVHSARIATDGPLAVDEFELSDRRDAKLDERTKARVLQILLNGAKPNRRRFGRAEKFEKRWFRSATSDDGTL